MIQRLSAPLAGLSAATFAALSALRGKRVFHPIGVAYVGELELFAPSKLRLPTGSRRVIARFSRGGGMPESLPDVLGIALKVPNPSARGGEQDLLLASSGNGPAVRRLLLPAKSFFRATYSSVLTYRAGGEQFLFGARADPILRDRPGDLEDLRRAARQGDVRFELLAARPSESWTRIGSLTVGAECDRETADGLRFNPWNTDESLRPDGLLNRLRRSAYPASQEARPDSEPEEGPAKRPLEGAM